jgi:uncharacterized protein YggE
MRSLINNISRTGVARLALVAALLVGLTTMPRPAAAQDTNIFTIEVQAVGTAVGTPDRASLQLGIEVVGTDLQASLTDVEAKSQSIIDALLDLGIGTADVQTGAVQITSQDLQDPNTGVITGDLVYHVNSDMQVIVRDLSTIQSVITTAVTNGANTLDSVTMGIEDLESLEQEARQSAIANAYQRAQALAAGFNLVLSAPIIVTETIGNEGLPVPLSGTDVRRSILDTDGASLSESPLMLTVQLNVVFRTQTQTSTTITPRNNATTPTPETDTDQ